MPDGFKCLHRCTSKVGSCASCQETALPVLKGGGCPLGGFSCLLLRVSAIISDLSVQGIVSLGQASPIIRYGKACVRCACSSVASLGFHSYYAGINLQILFLSFMYTHPADLRQTHPPWCRCPCSTKLFGVPSLSPAHKKDGISWDTPFPAKYHPWCPYLYSVGDWPYRRPVFSISTQILFTLALLQTDRLLPQ